jgi:hypothetical protein
MGKWPSCRDSLSAYRILIKEAPEVNENIFEDRRKKLDRRTTYHSTDSFLCRRRSSDRRSVSTERSSQNWWLQTRYVVSDSII